MTSKAEALEFEKYPRLARNIEKLANTPCDFSMVFWSDFLQSLNDALKQAALEQAEGVDVEGLRQQAQRYERLRVLGCAPMNSRQLEEGSVLRFQSLDKFVDRDIKNYKRGEAQGHLRTAD